MFVRKYYQKTYRRGSIPKKIEREWCCPIEDNGENLSFQRPVTVSAASVTEAGTESVDGDISQDEASCSEISDGTDIAWWQVRLRRISTIEKIIIYYKRTDTPYIQKKRLAGFAIYVSNGTTAQSGRRCYHHSEGKYPNLYQNIPCVDIGRYVTVVVQRPPEDDFPASFCYSDEAILELCEVEVFGCEMGYYGRDCTRPCPSGCLDSQCDPDTGDCLYGCVDFVTGEKCEQECIYANCTEYCPNTCANGNCDYLGNCLGDCIPGYRGSRCEIPCGPEYYGPNCATRCYCDHGFCDSQNGSCPDNKCIEGWIPPTCSQVAFRQSLVQPDNMVPSSSFYIGMICSILVIAALTAGIVYLLREKKRMKKDNQKSIDDPSKRYTTLSVRDKQDKMPKTTDYVEPNPVQKQSVKRLPAVPPGPASKPNQYLDMPTYYLHPVKSVKKDSNPLSTDTRETVYEEEEDYYSLSK